MGFPTSFGRDAEERDENPLCAGGCFRWVSKVAVRNDFETHAGGFHECARLADVFVDAARFGLGVREADEIRPTLWEKAPPRTSVVAFHRFVECPQGEERSALNASAVRLHAKRREFIVDCSHVFAPI